MVGILLARSVLLLTAALLQLALAFAFGGFLSAQVGHINQLSASAWLPGVALAADLGLQRRSLRWALLAGLALKTYIAHRAGW